MKKWKGRLAAVLTVLCVVVPWAGIALADVEYKELGKVLDKATIGVDVHLFYRYDKDPYFGANIGATEKTDTGFAEILGKIRFTAEKNFDWSAMEVQVAPYFVSTIDQDVYGIYKDVNELEMDQAWVKFKKLLDGPFDLTIGRQDIQIEKWFVIADGELQPGAAWLAFHYSFPFGVRLDGDFGPFKTTAFWARSNDYYQKWDEGVKDDVEVAGINLHLDISKHAFIYGGVFRKIDDSNLSIAPFTPGDKAYLAENDTLAWDIGADVTIAGLKLEGEFVYETGDAGRLGGAEVDRKAFGGFASVTYTLPVPYSPFIKGTLLHYSGDDDLEDDEIQTYDPMFFSFVGWNRWIAGELTGEAHLPNSNKQVIIAEAGFSPLETMTVTAMYMNHELDEKNWLNIPTASSDWADEINLFMDYQVNSHLFWHAGVGMVMPGEAAKEIMGKDDDAFFGQMWLSFTY